MIDMPLEQLKQYRGSNPKPADFDEYWDKALRDLEQTDMEVSITESDFVMPGVKCFDIYFTGVKGGRIYAKLVRPEKIRGKAPAVLRFHGYSSHSGEWAQYLDMVAAGFVVAALDTRGQAGKSEDINPVRGNTWRGHIIRGLSDPDPENLQFRQCFLDTVALTRIVMSLNYVDENKVVAMGASMGGGLAIACAALEPKIAKVVPTYPFLCDYKRVWNMDLPTVAYSELKDYFRMFDPLHEREEEIFTKLGYIDIQHLAPRIKGEVYFTTGLSDSTCPPSSAFAAYNNIVAPKMLRIYPDFGHEAIPYHDDGVFQFLKDLLCDTDASDVPYDAKSAVVADDETMPYPRVCAHRGFNTVAPENSMPAFGAAIALGAEEIEFDLWPTSDGEIVSIHDPVLDRVSDGSGFVFKHTYDELAKFDFGSKFSEKFAGLRIVKFEEILRKYSHQVIMNVHVKAIDDTSDYDEETFKKIVALIDKYDCRRHVYFMGTENILKVAMKVAPDICRCAGEHTDATDGKCESTIVERAIKYGCKKVQFFRPHFKPEMIKKAHENGIRCNVFWSDETELTEEYLSMGIDTILTNDYNIISQIVDKYKRSNNI